MDTRTAITEIDLEESTDAIYDTLIANAASQQDRQRQMQFNHTRPRRERVPTVESSEECKSNEIALTLNRKTITRDERHILSDDSMEDMYNSHTPIPIPDTITPMTCETNNNRLITFDTSINCSTGIGVARDRDKRRYSDNLRVNTPIVHTPMISVDSVELKSWLEKEVELPQYFDNFGSFGYESLSFVKAIKQKAELEEIGIIAKGHQTKLMSEIEKLEIREDQPEGMSNQDR